MAGLLDEEQTPQDAVRRYMDQHMDQRQTGFEQYNPNDISVPFPEMPTGFDPAILDKIKKMRPPGGYQLDPNNVLATPFQGFDVRAEHPTLPPEILQILKDRLGAMPPPDYTTINPAPMTAPPSADYTRMPVMTPEMVQYLNEVLRSNGLLGATE